jgi:hypothetical protein
VPVRFSVSGNRQRLENQPEELENCEKKSRGSACRRIEPVEKQRSLRKKSSIHPAWLTGSKVRFGMRSA